MAKHYDEKGHQVISTQEARQADIILRTRGMKIFFFGAMLSLLVIPPVMVWLYFGFPH